MILQICLDLYGTRRRVATCYYYCMFSVPITTVKLNQSHNVIKLFNDLI